MSHGLSVSFEDKVRRGILADTPSWIIESGYVCKNTKWTRRSVPTTTKEISPVRNGKRCISTHGRHHHSQPSQSDRCLGLHSLFHGPHHLTRSVRGLEVRRATRRYVVLTQDLQELDLTRSLEQESRSPTSTTDTVHPRPTRDPVVELRVRPGSSRESTTLEFLSSIRTLPTRASFRGPVPILVVYLPPVDTTTGQGPFRPEGVPLVTSVRLRPV